MENKPLEKENNVESIHNAAHGEEPSGSSPENLPNSSTDHDSHIPSAASEPLSGSPAESSESHDDSHSRLLSSPKQETVSDAPKGASSKKAKGSKAGRKKKSEPPADVPISVPVHNWFVTFMCMNIPIIGWIYLIILACSRSKGPRRDFAKAYLLYKLVFLLLSLAILAVAIHYGLELLDKVLAYMEML